MDFELSFVTQSIFVYCIVICTSHFNTCTKTKTEFAVSWFLPLRLFKEHSSDAAFVAQSNCLVFTRYICVSKDVMSCLQAKVINGAEKEAVAVEEVIKMKADCAEQKTH
ncbi:hypothetical protein CHARACLAT_031223 [Characodon lateralis]|uniref:Uncharacterized protein n=1 Tax=Characodon lateralis TaxID=208331 RepID=A0ABU7D257_9TELE|nr:hypothetical protein [Characodon lateralis]